MNTLEPAWNRARWIRVIAILFIGQIFLAWALGERKVHPERKVVEGAPVVLLAPQANEALARLPEVAGATLFALVNPQGVSGQAWLRGEPRENMLTEWQEPEFSLAPNPERLGMSFQRFIQTNSPQLTRAAVLPPLAPVAFDAPATRTTSASTLSLRGNLTERKLSAPITVPAWPVAATLSNSVVRLTVDASGEVFSAVLQNSSGYAAADKKALELAQELRFEPLPNAKRPTAIGADLTWGAVVFRWATTPPATNFSPTPP